jgi:superfamily II DNA or RNA helicase
MPKNIEVLSKKGFQVCIVDEAHKSGSASYRHVLNSLGFGWNTDHLLAGFSATPFREDEKGLGEVFDVIAFEKSISEMIAEGYLCPPRGLKIKTDLDFSEVKNSDGDFCASSLAELMDVPEMVELVVESYLKEAKGLKAIAFGVTVNHALNLAYCFEKHGLSSKAVYGEMPSSERDQIIQDYKEGKIDVLCNCSLLTEGFDAAHTACVIVARPTKSKGLYQQMIGRGLRLWPNKSECLVLDFGDLNHSLFSTAILLNDSNDANEKRQERANEREAFNSLPEKLNRKLKSAIVAFDPLGQEFTWEKQGQIYVMKGAGMSRLRISPVDSERYNVIFESDKGNRVIGDGLSFEYAFSASEDFAKENRKMFSISDQEALWRGLPISEKQMNYIRSCGYRSGIEHLTRGQAAQLISSGALKRAG